MVCRKCGFDRRLGRRPLVSALPRRSRALRIVLLIAVAVVAVVLASRLAWRDALRREAESSPRSTPAPAVATETVPATPPPATPLDVERALVREKLDRNQPLFKEGDEAAVRTKVGQIKRGRVVGRSTESVVLEARPGEEDTILFSDMDQASRLRCDPQFRESYVRYRAAQLSGQENRR
jgi:hypothetical protein